MRRRDKYEQVWEEKDGWSEWILPTMSNHRIACCDCHLVHTYEFRAVKRTGKEGELEQVEDLDSRKFMVMYRIKINKRATANMRRATG